MHMQKGVDIMETYRSEVEYIYGESNAKKQPHQHNNRCFPFVVAVYVISGKYICYCGGNTLIAGEGETLVVPEYVLHNIEMKEAGKLSWSHIRAHISGGDVLSGIKTPFVVGKELSGEIRYLIENLVETENGDCPLCQLYEQMYISKFFIEVMLNVDVIRNAEPVWITDIKEYITENISDKFTISGLAARCCMSESTFCHKFKQETGISPIRYIVNFAKKLH